jgi:hypothetical protein
VHRTKRAWLPAGIETVLRFYIYFVFVYHSLFLTLKGIW